MGEVHGQDAHMNDWSATIEAGRGLHVWQAAPMQQQQQQRAGRASNAGNRTGNACARRRTSYNDKS